MASILLFANLPRLSPYDYGKDALYEKDTRALMEKITLLGSWWLCIAKGCHANKSPPGGSPMVARSMMPNIQMVSLQQSTSLSRVARCRFDRFAQIRRRVLHISGVCFLNNQNRSPMLKANWLILPTKNLHDSKLGDFRYYLQFCQFAQFISCIILSSPSLAPEGH